MKQASNKIFFNYATVAPMSAAAYDASKAFLEEFYVVGPPEVLYKYDPQPEAVATEAAKLLNCSAEEITVIKNTSEGISIASEALPLDTGDEILVLANEYPANFLPWLKKKKDGLNVTVIPGTDNPKAFQDLLNAVSVRTKAVAISYAQYYDGYIGDMCQLSQICREKGI